jgi:hypothetical protein
MGLKKRMVVETEPLTPEELCERFIEVAYFGGSWASGEERAAALKAMAERRGGASTLESKAGETTLMGERARSRN